MKIEPVVSYICESCGKEFSNKNDCIYHEKDCRHWQRCPLCKGEGHYTLYMGIYSGHPRNCICSECNGRGEVWK